MQTNPAVEQRSCWAEKLSATHASLCFGISGFWKKSNHENHEGYRPNSAEEIYHGGIYHPLADRQRENPPMYFLIACCPLSSPPFPLIYSHSHFLFAPPLLWWRLGECSSSPRRSRWSRGHAKYIL